MRRVTALLLVLTLSATACGDDQVADDTTSTTEPATTQPPTTTVARPTIPVPEVSDVAALLALDRPIVAGHQGGDQSWPSSTMYGYVQAAVAGADVLEMDVQLTSDGVLVVQHDVTVDKSTETTGRVRDFTYDELQALDKGYWWSDEWPSHDRPDDAYVYRGMRTGDVEPPPGFTAEDFRMETFRAVAEAFPDHVLDIELKIPESDDGEGELDFAIEGARVLAEEIEELGRTDSVVVVSVSDDVLTAFRGLAPEVVTSPGIDAMFGWIVGATGFEPADLVLQLPPFYDGVEILSEDLIARAAEDGIEIWAWPDDAATQENADFYEELVEMGVDGVIAGHPELAVERYATLD